MGFADLGITGSEIRTPNIDALARSGALLTSMYNCARCCPTRASLLTGLYPHNAGIGHMGANLGTPAYQGYLSNESATIAETLRASGYRTLMTGKWHVGGDFEARDLDSWRIGEIDHPTPRQRGFDRFYGILEGATHFFSPYAMMEDDSRVEVQPDDFYFTDAITDKAIDLISDAVADEAPFFLYLAHIAPHWPLHAPAEDIARYEGVYENGWDAIRTSRHEEMNARGLFRTNWQISPRDSDVQPWETVANKDWEASKMAAYAAMVDKVDQSVGRLVAALKRLDQYEDTLILFLSDNGGCAEFVAEDGWAQYYPDRLPDGRQMTMGNVTGLRPGDAPDIPAMTGPGPMSPMRPFRLFKHYVHEGGISTPLIAHWPRGILEPVIVRKPLMSRMFCPPFLPQRVVRLFPNSTAIRSRQWTESHFWICLLAGTGPGTAIFFEHEGNCALRLGEFKLVRLHNGPWELYDMDLDRTELCNLAGKGGSMEADLRRRYADWASRANVLDWNSVLPRLLRAWGLDSPDG